MGADRSFLYAVAALEAEMIDSRQLKAFVAACDDLVGHENMAVPDLLAERGWIQESDKVHLEYLVERKLQKHEGDARAILARTSNDVKRCLAGLDNAAIDESLGGLPVPENSLLAVAVSRAIDRFSDADQRYSLSRLHATGGIGRVWLARDVQLGRNVALKELRPEQSDNAVVSARFLKEARITGQLEHPGIVPVYELSRRPDTGHPFYTMRFVKGRTLSETAHEFHRKRRVGQADSLEFSTLLNAFVLVCKTIAYAHSRGVIHRDLKGQNVIVGDFGEVVVLDWGLAKLVDGPEEDVDLCVVIPSAFISGKVDLTMQGQALGTPAYMAPEQAAGRVDLIDRRTDVYGLGAILYELLAGQPPFNDPDTSEVLRKVQVEEPPAPRQFWPDVPPSLEAACRRALAKPPEDRFASAGDLAHEVEKWQEVQRKQAEEALRASEALYHSLVESIPICVWRKDVEGRFTFANNGFLQAFGKKPEELLGKDDYELFPADLAEKYRRDDAQVRATGETLRVTEEQASREGIRTVEVIKIPIHDPRGEIVGTQGIFWDISAWKRAEQQSGTSNPQKS
jgi:PAS domain S-box-containing protein